MVCADLQPPPVRSFDLGADIILNNALPHVGPALRIRHWSLLFYSKDFVEEHPYMQLEDFRLSQARLIKLGVEVSRARKIMLDRALKEEN